MLSKINWKRMGTMTALVSVLSLPIPKVVFAQTEELTRVVNPNFRMAEQYSSSYLRQFVYSTSVTPNFIDKSDEFWYSFKTSEGTKYWRVNPEKGTRLPLFDHIKLAAQLSQLTRQPVEPGQLNLTRLEVSTKEDTLKFVVERTLFEYSLKSEEMKSLGAAPAAGAPTGAPPTTERGGRQRQEEQQEERKEQQEEQQDRREQQQERQQDRQQDEQKDQEEQRNDSQRGGQRGQQAGPESGPPRNNDAHRNFAPDRKSYVFAKGHNLYFVQIPETPVAEEKPEEKKDTPAEEAKTEEVKTEEVKTEETKTEETKTEETKTEETKTEETKTEETKTEETKTEETKTEETKTEETKTDEVKTDEVKTDEVKTDEVKTDEVKTDEVKTDEVKTDEVKTDEVKTDEVKTDEVKTDEVKTDEVKTDEVKTDEVKTDEVKTDEVKKDETKETESKKDSAPATPRPPRFNPKWDELAIQLTTDGSDKYSFAGRLVSRRGTTQEIKDDTLTRPNINWSKDSKSFYVTRSDSRGVKDLWVINSLSSPRPTLETYPYPMPGEENVRKTELHWFQVGNKALKPVQKRWKDEFYSDLRYSDSNEELRFLRRDRLLRNVEYCTLNLATGETKCLFEEGFDKSTIAPKGIRFLNDNKEMIWWSERSGWGHFYLYDADGKLKNAITFGPYFAERIVDLDEENRILYFTALGREPGENLNYRHLYSVRLDGRDLKLMDPGNADHASRLTPSKRFVIDNYNRVDMAPVSVLRDSNGVELMKLEECDLSRLEQVGWKIPETFVVKAADGVTDLFGNMYKPFNFDPKKKYPIITYVYPGPQQEGTRHTFTATAGEQQLAQIGFIVIQVGHRGGTPNRSKAYAGYGYFNLRDYALPDKKAAIEQLGQRFAFIDTERVGMYGHSGGGFMTAAALMVPPYNDFFKAGFSTAGNHDNNIYNNAWSERWHGLREVPVDQKNDGTQVSSTAQVQQRSAPSDLRAVLEVEPDDFFNDYELDVGESHWEFEQRLWGEDEPLPLWLREEMLEQERQVRRRQEGTQQEVGQDDSKTQNDEEKLTDQKKDEEKKEDGKKVDEKKEEESKEQKTRFEIKVPTNAELASNLKHHLFLVHGELDNNVHPANTLRLVDALIKANKKFDMLYLPATRHGFGAYQPYVTQRMFEFFADRLMLDYAEDKPTKPGN
ncbi:prolyl oligopeptidase family serine peptidase [Pirellulaceae bacterium SH449]